MMKNDEPLHVMDLVEIIDGFASSGRERFELSGREIQTLPKEISNLTHVTAMYIGNNGLTSLPPEIAALSSLKTLYLANNNLTTLPVAVTKLTGLLDLN